MSLLNIKRREQSKVANWNDDPKVVRARARLAELNEAIPQMESHIQVVHNEVNGAGALLERAEMEVLAGRASDNDLAKRQQAHLNARMAEAKEKLAVEDLLAEKGKLEQALPGIEKAAKTVSHKALRVKGAVLLREMRDAIKVLAQSEAEYEVMRMEGQQMFPIAVLDPRQPEHFDPDFSPYAGLGIFSRIQVSQGRREHIDLEGSTEMFLRDIEAILASLEADK